VLDQLSLVVSDMAATVAFYRRLGLAVPDADPEWDDVHRSTSPEEGIDLDFDTVDFAPKWNTGWPGGAGAVIGFRVDSREAVDEIYADLTGAGYAGQQPPWDAFWGARYAVVTDPDGRAVGIMSPVDPATRSEPPA
jgi:catechol 2,3-dioxygenase-like lactoylglutathione lyase family enzyme